VADNKQDALSRLSYQSSVVEDCDFLSTMAEWISTWVDKCTESADSESGWDSKVLNDQQLGQWVKEQARPPRTEPWQTWRPGWASEEILFDGPNRAEFSTNDWAVWEYGVYLTAPPGYRGGSGGM